MILFLPPAPHTGAFFNKIRDKLSDIDTRAGTYPGYGEVPSATAASIEAYAASVLPLDAGTRLIGFHTGCLVAIEIALQTSDISSDIGSLILVDIPHFDDLTKQKYAAGLDADNREQDAFRAAFAYDLDGALTRLSHKVICIATQSSLFEPTVKVAKQIKESQLIERRDITKPVFETTAMADLIRSLVL